MGLSPKSNYEKKKIVSCFDIGEVHRSPGKWNWNWLYFLPFFFIFKQGGGAQKWIFFTTKVSWIIKSKFHQWSKKSMGCEGACTHAPVRCAVARVRVCAKWPLKQVCKVRACGPFFHTCVTTHFPYFPMKTDGYFWFYLWILAVNLSGEPWCEP